MAIVKAEVYVGRYSTQKEPTRQLRLSYDSNGEWVELDVIYGVPRVIADSIAEAINEYFL